MTIRLKNQLNKLYKHKPQLVAPNINMILIPAKVMIHSSDCSQYFLNQRTRGKINVWDLVALELLRALFKPLNPYTLFTVSLLSLKQIIFKHFSRSKHSLFLFQNSDPQTLLDQRYDFYLSFALALRFRCP